MAKQYTVNEPGHTKTKSLPEAIGVELEPRALACALADPSCPSSLLRSVNTTAALRSLIAAQQCEAI